MEKLADEVVEDFMATDMMPRFTYALEEDAATSSTESQFEHLQDELPMESMTDSALEEDAQHREELVAAAVREEGGDLIDSASDTQNGSFKEKRAFFEGRSQASATAMKKFVTMTGTAAMNPTPGSEQEEAFRSDLYVDDSWNRPTPLRTTDRGGDIHIFNPSLSRVTRGKSWILDETSPTFTSSMVLEDRKREGNVSPAESWLHSGGTCVVRRVFHASSFADDDDDSSESSDGSVISVEINSCPRSANEDKRNNGRALEWFVTRDRPPPQMISLE